MGLKIGKLRLRAWTKDPHEATPFSLFIFTKKIWKKITQNNQNSISLIWLDQKKFLKLVWWGNSCSKPRTSINHCQLLEMSSMPWLLKRNSMYPIGTQNWLEYYRNPSEGTVEQLWSLTVQCAHIMTNKLSQLLDSATEPNRLKISQK